MTHYYPPKKSLSIHRATESSSLVPVTSVAAALTSGKALPIATPTVATLSMGMSLRLSPKVTILRVKHKTIKQNLMNLRNIYDSRRIWKMGLISISILLVAAFIYISNNLVKDLAKQERDRMEIWADATRRLATMNSGFATDDSTAVGAPVMMGDIDFLLRIIEGNHNIPVLLVDDLDNNKKMKMLHAVVDGLFGIKPKTGNK